MVELGIKELKTFSKLMFSPQNQIAENQLKIRNREPYHVNFVGTSQSKKSEIPYIQRSLNEHNQRHEWAWLPAAWREGPGGWRAGPGQGAWKARGQEEIFVV